MAKILIVDDDPVFSTMLSDYLKGKGHEVSRAADPIAFSASLRDKRPDAIIMDMQMPAGGAPGAQNILDKAGAPEIPVLFCSGMPPEKLKEWFPEKPSRRYIVKPPNLTRLSELLGELLAPGAPKGPDQGA